MTSYIMSVFLFSSNIEAESKRVGTLRDANLTRHAYNYLQSCGICPRRALIVASTRLSLCFTL